LTDPATQSLARYGCDNASAAITQRPGLHANAGAIGRGSIGRDSSRPENPIILARMSGETFSDADISQLLKWPELQEVFLGGTKVTDGGLSRLKDLKNLERLSLGEQLLGNNAQVETTRVGSGSPVDGRACR
jgi:hypothetical protein